MLVYNFASGDNTYPHSGTLTIGIAGKVTVDDSNGNDDALFGDFTHTGGADTPDQDVSASTVAGINIGDTIDLRYKYTITGSDGSTGTIHFIATNSTANYGPLFVSDTPLDPAVTYTFHTFNTDGAAPYSSLVPCFTSGTMIATAKGDILIDNLKVGDRIFTRDNGYQPLRWIGRCTVQAERKFAPLHIAKEVFGNTRDIIVSPNHRMLISGPRAELFFGEREVLVSAKHLQHAPSITTRAGGTVTYIHLLFDAHQLVLANGTYSESFHPGEMALQSLELDARKEVLTLFPELRTSIGRKSKQTARICLSQKEAFILDQLAA